MSGEEFKLPSDEAAPIADPNEEIAEPIKAMTVERLQQFRNEMKEAEEAGSDLIKYAHAVLGTVGKYFGIAPSK